MNSWRVNPNAAATRFCVSMNGPRGARNHFRTARPSFAPSRRPSSFADTSRCVSHARSSSPYVTR